MQVQVNKQVAEMLESGDFLALIEHFAGCYADTADESQMQYTDKIFAAVAQIREANKQ